MPASAPISVEGQTGPGYDTPTARQWVTLGIVLMSTVIVVLDTTVLNVAIPTILHEFDTTLPSLEWVITGYSLTFATFLIIGGRLGDIYGQRRVFITGAALFAGGSLLASLSWNVASLVVGEALIEGLGASLMLPATLALLSNTFQGRSRAMAFAAWGAVAGSAAGLGPVVGGLLTTDFSWRWAFRINVIIAPLAIIGALLFIPPTKRSGKREPLDGPGAALIALGMFLLVFALSEGGSYGWITPIASVDLGRHQVWSGHAAVSIIPLILLASFVVLYCFYRHERSREARNASPLFEFGLLHHRTFRYGLLTTTVLSMGQLGLSFALALFLQEGKHLTALQNGLWVLPYGLSIIVGAPIAGRLTARIGTITVIRLGLVMQTVGLVYMAIRISPHLTFLELVGGLVVYGLGAGFSITQLTNVILSDIPPTKSGVASGTNTTVRQVGSALGIAVIGTVVTTQTVNNAVAAIATTRSLSPATRATATVQVRALGANYEPPAGLPAHAAATLTRILESSVSTATHDALLFAASVVFLGACLSWLIPDNTRRARATDGERGDPAAEELAEELAAFVPVDPEAELLDGQPDRAAAGDRPL
jgi:EmrB/QacA subfamily drug resistance transporter